MSGKLDSVTDLSKLQNLTEDVFVACLRERFLHDHIYTALGSSALVALNPHKYVGSNSDAELAAYAHEYRDSNPGKMSSLKPPHIFQLANNAYYNMRRTSQDQSIMLVYVLFLIYRLANVSRVAFSVTVEKHVAENQRIGVWH